MSRKYRKPPIVEVVCEFRFIPSEPWDLTIPGLVYSKIEDKFPKKALVNRIETQEEPVSAGEVQQKIRFEEWARFLQEDEKAFTQIGPNLLSVNQLDPYPTWEGFFPVIGQCFQCYREVARPKGVRRIGLRYINRIDFQAARVHLEDYFLFYPFVGPGLPQDHGSFSTHVDFVYSPKEVLRLRLLSVEPSSPNTISCLLDLDYFLLKPESVELDRALDWISLAHGHIEEAFEACLTDKLRTIFEQIEG